MAFYTEKRISEERSRILAGGQLAEEGAIIKAPLLTPRYVVRFAGVAIFEEWHGVFTRTHFFLSLLLMAFMGLFLASCQSPDQTGTGTTGTTASGTAPTSAPASSTATQGSSSQQSASSDDNSSTSVSTPTFSPRAGTYSANQSVTISCDTPDAAVHYTTDGSQPTSSSSLYAGPIALETSGTRETINAIATKSGSPRTRQWQPRSTSSILHGRLLAQAAAKSIDEIPRRRGA